MNFNEEIYSIMIGETPLSYSALRAFLKSPKHFLEYKTDKEVTEAMEQGKRFHMAALEPEKFKSKYWCLDDTEKCNEIGGSRPRLTNAYKEWVLKQESEHPGQELIKVDEYETYIRMSDYLRINKATKELMSGLTSTEERFSFQYEGLKISGVIDGLKSEHYIIDLKKVADASFNKIRWKIKDDDLHMQGGMYCYEKKIDNYYLIFIDIKCNVTVVKLAKETLDQGFLRFEIALERFQDCAEQDLWNSSYEFYNNGYIEV